MKRTLSWLILAAVSASALSGCTEDPSVRITREKPAAPLVAPRNEPIFYNGKTYRLEFSPTTGGVYNMAVSGMTPKQQKDAVAVATSSLGYFACPDGQRGKLQGNPTYVDAKWRMQAKCG